MTSPKKRRSAHVATQLDVPQPSDKELARWKPLVDLCKRLVLTNESADRWKNGKNKIRIAFPSKYGKPIIPEGWPRGIRKEVVGDGSKVSLEYNAEYVLIWLYERKLSNKSPSMLYKERSSAISSVNCMLNSLDIFVDSAYNVDIKEFEEE